jgi:hypothetical protein
VGDVAGWDAVAGYDGGDVKKSGSEFSSLEERAVGSQWREQKTV